jgi:signal transduction histidine kinase
MTAFTADRSPRLRGRELLRAVAEGTASSVGDEFLRCLVRHVAEALAAKMVMVTETCDPQGKRVRMLAGWYDGAPIDRPIEYETKGQPCALVPGESVVAYPQELGRHFPEDTAAIELGLESYFAVCLRDSQDNYLGHLAVFDTRRMEAGPDDVAALRIFASRASAELERRNQAEALAESRARVIEAADQERRRVGRDLHDGAQQRLLAVSNLLRVARKKPESADDLLALAADELSAAHAELRELARGLHPVALTDRGLPAAIESLTSASTVPVEVEVCSDDLPESIAAAAYFVVAECLTNASRYGHAKAVRVCVSRDGERLEIDVSDDGVGGADATRGTGLRGLADRVELLGGSLELHSPPREGTRIVARVPLVAG